MLCRYSGRTFSIFLVILGYVTIPGCEVDSPQVFLKDWATDINQHWVGPEFWANRLQDWQISDGRLECEESNKPMRTVHILTHALSKETGSFTISSSLGLINPQSLQSDGLGGFLIGAGAGELEYKAASLIHHGGGPNGGIIAAVNGEGNLVFQNMGKSGYPALKKSKKRIDQLENVRLMLNAEPKNTEKYLLTLKILDSSKGEALSQLEYIVDSEKLVGNIALVSHPGSAQSRYWFDKLEIKGTKIQADQERTFGPVIGVQYTLSDDVLKLTAQMAPVQITESEPVYLDIKKPGSGDWEQIRKHQIDSLGWVVPYRIYNWKYKKEIPYRIRFNGSAITKDQENYSWEGIIQPNKGWRDSVKIAALSCQTLTGNNPRGTIPSMQRTWGGVDQNKVDWSHNYLWFPHHDMIKNVKQQQVDFYAFLGDQIYEGGSPTQPDRRGGIKSELDYLYKWYLWYWSFGDLLRETPSITIPDDHDVFQGNLWGAGGKQAKGGAKSGGYVMSPEFVNLVQKTQTSHLPDPYDSDSPPVGQEISVYYTDYNLGGVSFAILEDRKFKSPPSTPDEKADLLGSRQMEFLNEWITNWDQAWMKTTLSQTIFAAVHTEGVNKRSETVSDKDTNGWPSAKRDSVLKILRQGYAFMIGGDQHLSTVVHHGVDQWNDSGYSFAVPAVSNFFARAWKPVNPGKNQKPGAPWYTGEFKDGFGNFVTLHAAANPKDSGREPAALYDKAPGYGIIKFYKSSRKITMESWPRYATKNKQQYPGWPITIEQLDNYGREAAGYLPTLLFSSGKDPVVQVINESTDEILYTLRIEGEKFRPKVFDTEATFSVNFGFPEQNKFKIKRGIKPVSDDTVIQIEI